MPDRRRRRRAGGGFFRTESMAIAAFLHGPQAGKHGIQIRSAKRVNGPSRFEFAFSDPQRKAAELAVEFANSECRQFDDAMRSLKSLLSSSRRTTGPPEGG